VKREVLEGEMRECVLFPFCLVPLYIGSAALHVADENHTLGRMSFRILNFQGQLPWLSFYLQVSYSKIESFSSYPIYPSFSELDISFNTQFGLI
jgi:hypothetical protein